MKAFRAIVKKADWQVATQWQTLPTGSTILKPAGPLHSELMRLVGRSEG
jgi:hypothetical protein